MASELLHRLQTELDSAEADLCISLLDGWVELPQRQHRLSIGLFVEGDLTVESPRRRRLARDEQEPAGQLIEQRRACMLTSNDGVRSEGDPRRAPPWR